MSTPVADSIPLPTAVNNGNGSLQEEFVSGLVQGGSWDFGAGPRELTWSLDLAFDGATVAWTQAWIDAVTQAFAAWEAVIDVDFVFTGTPGTQSQNQSTADLSIVLEASGGGYLGVGIFPDPDFADETLDALGYTRNSGAFPYPNPEGDVAFNSDHALMSNLAAGSAGYYVILHELGHALGLKHADDDGGNGRPTFLDLGAGAYLSQGYTIVSSGAYFPSGSYSTTPGLLDILAIQHIYGANDSYRAGNDTYTIGNGSYRAIWDAGGIDTFSAASWAGTGGVHIDLREGAFSGVFAGARKTAIAYDATIERAVGSDRADRIIGNDANNLLKGGAGNDTLEGGVGNDVLLGGGGDDRLIGGVDNDSLAWGGRNTAILGGSGTDTLRVYGADRTVDLTRAADTLISDVERADLTGIGNNRLVVALADVLAISSTTDTLTVLGDAGDVVTLVGGFSDRGMVAGFHRYKSGAAVVMVDPDVTVVL